MVNATSRYVASDPLLLSSIGKRHSYKSGIFSILHTEKLSRGDRLQV